MSSTIPPDASPLETPGRGQSRLAVWVRLGVLAVCLAVAYVVATSWDRWTGSAAVQRTNDAYTSADLTPMGARVAGIVEAVLVGDFQRVAAGDVLLQIRDDDYRAQVAQSEADLEASQAQLANLEAQKTQQEANVAAAVSGVGALEADLSRDASEAKRQQELLASGIAGTRQRVEQADASSRAASANLLRAQAQVRAAVAQLDVIGAQQKQARAAIAGKQASVDLARINLSYTRIIAPAEGEVGQRLVRPGQYVGVGTQVITLVSLPNVWVIANYKETQLTNVSAGLPASVTVDAFPGVVIGGRVDSVSPGSGGQFALLPPDNATGNFTKVVQRIPVKIVLDANHPLTDRLRPGMSVVASIDTRATPP